MRKARRTGCWRCCPGSPTGRRTAMVVCLEKRAGERTEVEEVDDVERVARAGGGRQAWRGMAMSALPARKTKKLKAATNVTRCDHCDPQGRRHRKGLASLRLCLTNEVCFAEAKFRQDFITTELGPNFAGVMARARKRKSESRRHGDDIDAHTRNMFVRRCFRMLVVRCTTIIYNLEACNPLEVFPGRIFTSRSYSILPRMSRSLHV